MEDIKALNKTILDIEKNLSESRVKLDEDVFITRHLPTIIKNGGPTEELQNELVRVAGGESKRINLVSKEGEVILTLPSALSNGSVIDITKDKEAAKTIKMLNTPHQGVLDPAKEKYNNTAIEKTKSHADQLKNDWGFVIEHYKDKVVVPTQTMPTKKIIIEDEYDYD